MWTPKLLRPVAPHSVYPAASRRLCPLFPSPRRPKAPAPPPLAVRRALFVRGFASSSNEFKCQSCGQTFVKWQGKCSSCSQWGSIVAAEMETPFYCQSNAASFPRATSKRRAAPLKTELRPGTSEMDGPQASRMNQVELHTSVERLELPDRELVSRNAGTSAWYKGYYLICGSCCRTGCSGEVSLLAP
uniref:LapB rubredoxin metal binding domain-containing protein n=1 Tax=Peronospora matthiolae TaxID=2874970 RepID=A0AAV1UU35_9STRA